MRPMSDLSGTRRTALPENSTAQPPTVGETMRVKASVPTWGGREGEVVRVSLGGVQLRIGVGLLWFDPWEVEALS